jgi:SAM-dependent methyltransferase
MAHYSFYAKKKISSPGAWINQIAAKKLASLLLRALTNGANDAPAVLEIGPGKGMFASCLLQQRKVRYTAYEPEQQLFEHLRSQGLTVINKAVPPIELDNASIDAVAMLNILEHIADIPSVERIIQECFRVLKPGGIIFIVVPSYLDWKEQFFNLDYTHQTPFTESRLRNLLADNGGTVVRLSYHYGCFFSGLGRLCNKALRTGLKVLSLALPRSVSRSEGYQKAGILFAENIVCFAKKNPT